MTEPLTLVPGDALGDGEDVVLPTPSDARFRLLRVGIEGLWEYPAGTRFLANGGWLHFRGANEAGKSKAIELVLPAVLDGHLTSTRLDPHRSTGKTMRWNLLGPHAPDGATTGTGYAFAEFGRLDGDGEHIVTCGYGVRAARSGTSHTSWLFVAEDVRIDRDLDLTPGRTPLTEGQLREAIGGAGSVHDLETHRAHVARTLFTTDANRLGQLLELVLQLRTPQLGKTLDVAALSTKLGEAMPQVDTRLLGEVAEAFQQLQEDRAQLAELETAAGQLDAFNTTYREYLRNRIGHDAGQLSVRRNEARIADRQVRLLGELLSAPQIRRLDSEADRALAATSVPRLRSRRARLDRALTRSDAVQQRVASARDTLLQSDAYRAIGRLGEVSQQIQRLRPQVAQSRDRVASLDEALAEAMAELAMREQARDELAATVTGRVAGVRERGEAVGVLADVDRALGDLPVHPDRAAVDRTVGLLVATAKARRRALAAVRQAHEQLRQQRDRERAAAGEVERARERVAIAEARLAQTQVAVDTARAAWADRVLEWTRGLRELPAAPFAEHREDPDAVARTLAAESATIEAVLAGLAADAETDRRAADDERQRLTAAIDDLEARRDPAPPRSPWRTGGGPSGARPLHTTVEPRADVDDSLLAAIEAGLLGAGLLDALIHPDGTVVARDGQALAVAVDPPTGPTLADVLEVSPDAEVPNARLTAVLRGIALVDSCDDQATRPAVHADAAAVGRDGTFRNGALAGRQPVTDVGFLGVRARQRTRAARLSLLRTELAAAEQQHGDAVARQQEVRARRRALASEHQTVPSTRQLDDARADVRQAAAALGDARGERETALEALAVTTGHVRDARSRLDAVALDNELADWVDTLDDFADTLVELESATTHLRDVLVDLSGAVARVDDQVVARSRIRDHRDSEAAGLTRATAELESLAGEEDGLRAAIDGDPDDLLRQADQLRERLSMLRAVHGRMLTRVGEWRMLAERRDAELDGALDEQRRARRAVEETVAAFRAHETSGRLRLAFDEDELGDLPSGEWTVRTVRDLANTLVAAAVPADRRNASVEVRAGWLAGRADQVDAEVERAFTQLDRQLRPTYSPVQTRHDGVRGYAIALDGREHDLLAFGRVLADDVEARRTRLTEQDAELLRQFLTGQVRRNLVDTMRQADSLVRGISTTLGGVATNSGKRVRLSWTPTASHREVVDLLLQGQALRSHEGDQRLEDFLRAQLADARAAADDPDEDAPLEQLLVDRLDYRSWHQFQVQVADPAVDDGAWRTLTSRSHGTGSGGSKSMLLHLPLFAAVAAWYDGAGPHCPRLAVLDEAFAGIDDGLTAELLALAVELDLDLVTTAHDAWFCHPSVPALAVYSLHRDASLHVVDAERFTWDGHVRVADEVS